MEKNAFLRELALILRQRNLTDDEIRIRIEKISAFIDGLSPEERNAVIGGNPNVAAIADRLFTKGNTAKPAENDNEKKNEGKPTTEKEAPKANAPSDSASGSGEVHNKGDKDTPSAIDGSPNSFRITSDYKKKEKESQNERKEREGGSAGRNIAEIRRKDEEKLKKLKSEAEAPRKKNNVSLSEKYESERNFWVIFFCCIPVLFFFGAVILSIFAAIFCMLVGVIILLIAALAVAVAIGSGIALIGIFYGILQMLSGEFAIGLYEASLGIIAAGVTMLVGVLIYNAAIRFIPFIMKQLKKLFKFVLKKIGVLANYLKGVCATL